MIDPWLVDKTTASAHHLACKHNNLARHTCPAHGTSCPLSICLTCGAKIWDR